jgi:hypothetical protein
MTTTTLPTRVRVAVELAVARGDHLGAALLLERAILDAPVQHRAPLEQARHWLEEQMPERPSLPEIRA